MNITIKGCPRTKKNSQVISTVAGKPRLFPSRQFRDYERTVIAQITPDLMQQIDYPVNVKCVYYMNNKRACDLNNLLEATTDILVHAKVVADDNYKIIASHDGSRVFYDHDRPRTEITITRVDYDDGQ